MKISAIFFAAVALSLSAYSASITAFMSYGVFKSPANGPYVETYISVMGNTVTYIKNKNGKYQGIIEIDLLFKQGDTIRSAKKYNLLSPEIADTSTEKINFVDQQRILLPEGNYDLEIRISDKNKPGSSFAAVQKISLDFPKTGMSISDIEMIESYTKTTAQNALSKSGYDLVPYTSNFYPENMHQLGFYAEIYDAKRSLGENEIFLINYYIQSYETKATMSKFNGFAKQKAGDVNIVLAEFPLEELLSGNYNLVVEARDKTGKLLAEKKVFLQRRSDKPNLSSEALAAIDIEKSFVASISGKDTIAGYIRCLRPISSEAERKFSENQLKIADIQLMKQYFFNFWVKRDPDHPEQSWLNYYKEVQIVNQKFRCGNIKGYDTDRGRVYLQYGPPDQRTVRTADISCYPYEIWHYYSLVNKSNKNTQQNKKFLFYSPNSQDCDHILLYSDAISEVQERQWARIICPDDPMNPLSPASSYKNTKVDDRANIENDVEKQARERLRELFQDPR